eukprot:6621164-Pyramimonas_sp.AAC.1
MQASPPPSPTEDGGKLSTVQDLKFTLQHKGKGINLRVYCCAEMPLRNRCPEPERILCAVCGRDVDA